MAKVRPFRATYYAPDQTDFARVISPPYDVISPALQAQLYARDEHNFVRIDYGQTLPDDAPGSNVYSRSARTLADWLAAGVFTTDATPGYYLHSQRFEHHGAGHTRRDLFVLCEAAPFEAKQVLPHERTLDGPKADRYALMESVQSHLSPVFSLYQDPANQLVSRLEAFAAGHVPLFSFTDNDGIEHSVHACHSPALVEEITGFLGAKPLYIADGHHRYETALAFRKAHYPAIEAAGYVCMYLSALQDPGLLVLPYHRLIRSRFAWPDQETLLASLSDYFEAEAIAPAEIETALAATPGEMRLVMQTPEGCWLLRRPSGLPEGFADTRASSYRSLDVSVLHELLLYQLAGFPSAKSKDPDYIQFSPEISVLQETLRTEGGVAFFLNATPVSALCEIAEQGETMPPKSTYFYPKVPSGLLFTRFDSAF